MPSAMTATSMARKLTSAVIEPPLAAAPMIAQGTAMAAARSAALTPASGATHRDSRSITLASPHFL